MLSGNVAWGLAESRACWMRRRRWVKPRLAVVPRDSLVYELRADRRDKRRSFTPERYIALEN